ncbi:MAG: hypothetical protein JRI97_12500, partial [Deltaproteobacteria bacterium]|nr:hypothetical protein [Deltaproteobacteria bacterium]
MAAPRKKQKQNKPDWDLNSLFENRVKHEIPKAPWVLRVTEHKDKTPPVFFVKERVSPDQRDDAEDLVAPRSVLRERGLVYGEEQRRVLPVIRTILSRIQDKNGVPLELHRFLNDKSLDFRGNLPLDEEAGFKLALIFKL